jgi:hypothetical protein
MAIPDYQTCMLPLLRLVSDGKEHQLKDVASPLALEFFLTEDELKQFLPSGLQPVFINRVAWARTYLGKAGLLYSTRRGFFKITSKGLELLSSGITELNTKFLERYPEFQEFRAGRGEVRSQDRIVTVTVPENSEIVPTGSNETEIRTSYHIQAIIAQIGEKMGLNIWLPRSDRGNVTKEWSPSNATLLDSLPLNYDETTIKTIEQIDVIWLKKRSIVRAFEVEHTTSVYSGLLRMADLLALQPNMDIHLHIVAPASRREKVFQEIQRPVFSLLDRAPLYECCSYISYDSLEQLAQERHLEHLSDSVLDEYSEWAE